MVDAAAVEWFLAESPRPAPALRLRPPAVVSTASVAATMPIEMLELIIKHAWLSDASAPRLAAVDHSYNMANERAAFALEGADVFPPRADVTCPPRRSIDPTSGEAVVAFREQWSAWGLALQSYAEFKVLVPKAREHVDPPPFPDGRPTGLVLPFGKRDMTNLLDLGSYSGQLNNIMIDAFLSTKMTDVFTATCIIMSGGEPPEEVYIPCAFSAYYNDGLRNTVQPFVLDAMALALKHAKQVFQPYHFGETAGHENHWVLIRLNTEVAKVETYESASLVDSPAVGRKVLSQVHEFMLGTAPAADWSAVLYASAEQGMPRQRDGRSCGVFICVIAEHLLKKAKLPRRLQVNINDWRMYIAATIYQARLVAA